jgi:hypothetical protein
MTRSAARPPEGIQPTPPAPPAAGPAAPAEAPKAAGLSPGWRVALFVWATAFVFLLIYELLTTLVRSLPRLF